MSAPEEIDETQILAALLGIAEMVGDLTDIDELLEAVVRIAPSLVRVDRCAILSYIEPSREFLTRVSFGPPGTEAAFDDLRIPESEMPRLAHRLVALHLPALVKPDSRDLVLPAPLLKRIGLRSALLVPLVSRGRTLGVLWLDHSVHSHYFTSKEINVIQGVATSLTMALDRAARIAALDLEHRRFEVLARSLADGVIVLDRDLRILEMNPSAEDLLGWQSSEVRGRRAQELFSLTEAQASVAWTRDARTLSPAPKSLLLRTRDGGSVACDLLAIPVRGDAGETLQVLYVLRAATASPPVASGPAAASVRR